jgi:hypothetical protein
LIDDSSLSELEPSPARDLERKAEASGCEAFPLAGEFG